MGKKYKVSIPYTCTVTVEVEIDDHEIAEFKNGCDGDEDLFNDELEEFAEERAVSQVDIRYFSGGVNSDRLVGVFDGSIEIGDIDWDKDFHVEEI